MFTVKYRPTDLQGFLGNKSAIQSFVQWLSEWNPKVKNKCALVSGKCGIGKSLLSELVLKTQNYNIVNLALDDERNKAHMEMKIKPLVKTQTTYSGQKNALIVSDIDGGCDYGFVSNLVECIKISEIPIICICDNRYDQSIRSITNYCLDVKLIKPHVQEVCKFMCNIVIAEKIKMKESDIKDLYEQSNGDIRFMLNTLQFGSKSSVKNIQSSNIFETTEKMLSIDESLNGKYETYWLENDMHLLMVQENYINNTLGVRDEVKKMENVSYSADALSDSAVFKEFVNMTYWEFEPYVAMSVIKTTCKCNNKSMMNFPQYLGRTSTMNKNKREKVNYENVDFMGEKKKEPKPKVTKDPKPKVTKEPKPKVTKEPKPKTTKEPKPKVTKEKTPKPKEEEKEAPKKRGRPKKIQTEQSSPN